MYENNIARNYIFNWYLDGHAIPYYPGFRGYKGSQGKNGYPRFADIVYLYGYYGENYDNNGDGFYRSTDEQINQANNYEDENHRLPDLLDQDMEETIIT